MTVTQLIEKLRQVPQDLDVHVMTHLEGDLVNIVSVDLVAEPFTDEPFVVIDLLQNRGALIQDLQYEEHAARQNYDYSSPPQRGFMKQ